jgi:hypothetical protein
MVRGLQKFITHFQGYESSYVLIGGTACSHCIEKENLAFRSTKDLDIMLIVEMLDDAFVKAFWDFIRQGGYKNRQKSSGKPLLYRFFSPADETFPYMLELFSKKSENVQLDQGQLLTPLTNEEARFSLSAIIMDEDFYNLIVSNKVLEDGISIIPAKILIPLKAYAFLDLQDRHKRSEPIDSKDIKKHRNDIIRLSFILRDTDSIVLHQKAYSALARFIDDILQEPPDIKAIAKEMGIPRAPSLQDIVDILKSVFTRAV